MLATLAQVLILVFQSDPIPPSPSPSSPTSSSPSDSASDPNAAASWSSRYSQARAEMLAGHFAAAAGQFAALTLDAPDPARSALARDQHDICDRWARGGFVLVHSAEL